MLDKYQGLQPFDLFQKIKNKRYTIRRLPFNEWPEVLPLNNNSSVENFVNKQYTCDSNGFAVFVQDGEQIFKPVFVAQSGLNAIRAYAESSEYNYLHFAELQAQNLISHAVECCNSLQFPYNFDLQLHNIAGEEHTLKAPWHSGMAQGQILSLFSILFHLTGNSHYLDLSNKVFNGFLKREENNEIWVVYQDDLGFFWIEEYPQPYIPSNTLNGKIFSMFGLYNFLQVTKNDDAYNLFHESLKTIEFYIPQFRVPGGVSYYNLKYKKQMANYHKTHVRQLLTLFKITGDKVFLNFGNLLRKDHW